MPFRFFTINCWELTSFCNIHPLDNPNTKVLCVASHLFLFKSRGNFSRRPTMDYNKYIFPVLCILTSLPANKLPHKGLQS